MIPYTLLKIRPLGQSNIIATSSIKSKNKNSVLKVTDIATIIVVDFRDVMYRYGPSTMTDQLASIDKKQIIRRFLEKYSIREIIESVTVVSRTLPEWDEVPWNFIEHQFPDGTGELEDDTEACWLLDLLFHHVVRDIDDKINEALTSSRFKPNEYVFDHWVNQTTAVLHLV